MQKQPGCWLRSSHTFKECVIAHWSSEFARKINGAKLSTEIADYVHLPICKQEEKKTKVRKDRVRIQTALVYRVYIKEKICILVNVHSGRGAFCSRVKVDRKDYWTKQKRECWNK